MTLALDLFEPAGQQRPFETYAGLREHGAVHVVDPATSPLTFVVSDYEPVRAVLADPRTFSSRVRQAPVILFLDPPDHDRIRRTIARAFTPKRIAGLEPRIDEIATALIAPYVAAGGGDFIAGVAGRLPVYVIGEVLGVPTGDWEQLREWSESTVRALSVAPDDVGHPFVVGALALHQYLSDVADRRRAEPDDSIASRLVAFASAGEISNEELVGFLQLMFVAGHETTTALLAHTLELLAGVPALVKAVQEDPDLVGPLVEEVLRAFSPLQRVFRVATTDTQIAGVDIPAGSNVVVLIGAANRDGHRFVAGDHVDLDAADSAHLAFGQGIHYCLGAPLARLEARVAISRIVDTVGAVRLDTRRPINRFAGGTTSELLTTALWLHVDPIQEET
jgi:cytochrome P450